MTLLLDIRRPSRVVAEVNLNRPDVRNAFDHRVIAELTATFTAFAAESDLRAVVLGGHGKAFCAGADLSWMKARAGFDRAENRADAQALADRPWAVWCCPVPAGRVQGDCYGVGLAAVCDVRVAAEVVTLCLSEAQLGLLPATISPYVIRAMSEQAARRCFVTAERFSATLAAAMGFVPEACAADALDAKGDESVAVLVVNGPMATKACKRLVQDFAGLPITAELREDFACGSADIRASGEGREGAQSFLNKRPPNWLA